MLSWLNIFIILLVSVSLFVIISSTKMGLTITASMFAVVLFIVLVLAKNTEIARK